MTARLLLWLAACGLCTVAHGAANATTAAAASTAAATWSHPAGSGTPLTETPSRASVPPVPDGNDGGGSSSSKLAVALSAVALAFTFVMCSTTLVVGVYVFKRKGQVLRVQPSNTALLPTALATEATRVVVPVQKNPSRKAGGTDTSMHQHQHRPGGGKDNGPAAQRRQPNPTEDEDTRSTNSPKSNEESESTPVLPSHVTAEPDPEPARDGERKPGLSAEAEGRGTSRNATSRKGKGKGSKGEEGESKGEGKRKGKDRGEGEHLAAATADRSVSAWQGRGDVNAAQIDIVTGGAVDRSSRQRRTTPRSLGAQTREGRPDPTDSDTSPSKRTPASSVISGHGIAARAPPGQKGALAPVDMFAGGEPPSQAYGMHGMPASGAQAQQPRSSQQASPRASAESPHYMDADYETHGAPPPFEETVPVLSLSMPEVGTFLGHLAEGDNEDSEDQINSWTSAR